MYPKFDIIGTIMDPFLRLALYMSTGKDRERLEVAFPECYTEEVTTVRVPYSVASALARKRWSREGYENEMLDFLACVCIGHGLREFGIPIGFSWGDMATEDVPAEIIQQLNGRTVNGPIVLEYLGKKFVVAHLGISQDHRLGIEIKNMNAQEDYIEIYLLDFIDLNS